jgi:hypothetical protein
MAQKIIDLAAPTLPLVGTELMEMSEGGTLSVQVAVNEALTKLYYNTVEKAAATVTGISVAEYVDSDTGVLRTSGDLSIEGDLFVDGTTWVVHNQEVTTSDNLIVINYGETGPGVTAGWAGIEVDRGTETNYQFLFYEDTDTFRIGEIGNLQAVATREDSPIDGGIAFWNASEFRFDTSSFLTTDGTSLTVLGFIQLDSGTSVNEFSIDGTLGGDSDDAVPTEKAVKTYVDNAIGNLEAGNESLSNGDTTAEIIFSQTQSDTNYSQFWSIENSVDNPPSIFTGVVYDKTVNGFKVLFSGTIDSNNYVLSWGII